MARSVILLLATFLITIPGGCAEKPKNIPEAGQVEPLGDDTPKPLAEKKTTEPSTEKPKEIPEAAQVDPFGGSTPKPHANKKNSESSAEKSKENPDTAQVDPFGDDTPKPLAEKKTTEPSAEKPKEIPEAAQVDPFGGSTPKPHAEKKTTESSEKPKKKLTEQEIKALVDKLVSPNPKPITGKEDPDAAPDYRLPPGFDREKQKLVRKAVSELKVLGPQAFPFLIERWDDERYCLTISEGINGYCRNQTVGKTCKMIIFDQIQPFGMTQGINDTGLKYVRRPGYPSHFLSTKTDAKKWCEEHKGKSLAEIQLEALDWVIAEESKEKDMYPDKERENLQELRKRLIENKDLLPPGHRGHYCPIDIEE
jgi:hypothetical protein